MYDWLREQVELKAQGADDLEAGSGDMRLVLAKEQRTKGRQGRG